MKIATKRAVLAQAWFVARKRIDQNGIAQLTAEEEAGRLLARHQSANAAFVLCKLEAAKPFLAQVVKEEGGYIEPSGRTAG